MYVKPNNLSSLGFMVRGDTVMSAKQKLVTVAASQTLYPGDILVLSSGAVQQSIAAPAAGSATLSGGSLAPYAIACEGIVTNSAGVEAATGKTQISVLPLDGNVRLALRIYNATDTASQLQDLTQGSRYQFARYTPPTTATTTSNGGFIPTGNPFYCLSTTTTTGEMVYDEAYAGSAAADFFGVLWARVNAYSG